MDELGRGSQSINANPDGNGRDDPSGIRKGKDGLWIYPIVIVWVLVLWVVGFILDLLNLSQYRAEGKAIAAQDDG